MKNFYFNTKKTYKFKELLTNWVLTVNVICFIVFISLTLTYIQFSSQGDFYTKKTLVDGIVIESTSINFLGKTLIFLFYAMFFLVSSFIFLKNKWELRINRKNYAKKQDFKNLYPKENIMQMKQKQLVVLAKEMIKAKIVHLSKSKQEELDNLTNNQLKWLILENLYPCTTQIVVNNKFVTKQDQEKQEKEQSYGSKNT